jgi:hypothetical protein
MDDWIDELRSGSSEAAWDLFLARYPRVIFAAIYHYARDPDDAMDIFACVTNALRRDDRRRLRRYVERPSDGARQCRIQPRVSRARRIARAARAVGNPAGRPVSNSSPHRRFTMKV